MQLFVRDDCTMIAAPVQCDVDGIPKGSHCVRPPIVIGPPNDRVQQRGRLRGLHASESRHAGPVCCNGWFGLSVVSRASPDYVAPPPSTMRRTTLPRTGLC